MVKTTVVIPNYKGIKYIDACLHSLYEGVRVPKVIVVDNCSGDGSLEIIRERYPKVKVIGFPENQGFCRAVNAGIKAADTEYVLLLNNDTVSDTRMVLALEEALDKDPKAFSAAAKMVLLHSPDKLDGAGDLYSALGWAFARGKDKPVSAYNRGGRVFAVCAGAALYRKEIFDNIGYFDESHFAYMEDMDLGYRANIYGYHNIYVPDAVVFHAGSGVSGSRHNAFKVKLSSRNNVYLIYKNMPFLQMILNMPFLVIGYLAKLMFFSLKGLGRPYLAGSFEGLSLCGSPYGKEKKVKFLPKNLKNYIWIQGQLWVNVLRRL